MKSKDRTHGIVIVVLSFIGVAGFPTASSYADENSKYLDAVREFADNVLKYGRDTYGPKHTPLFVDGLNIYTHEPVKWKCRGEIWILSNFASQQPLLRTLDGLTALTGQKKYRRAAENATRYALKYLLSPNGLLYWGGHLAWDLEQERPIGQYADVHELKGHQPYYRLMWRVDASAARQLMEAVWAAHILDWSLLDYNRHASVKKRLSPPWDHEFKEDIEVPFPAKGNNLSFVNVTPPLLHSAAMLAVLDENTDALTWTNRLIYRWQQSRHPKTGLCGGQLSYRKNDRAQDALGHVHPSINEAKIVASYHQVCRYHHLPLAQMQAGLTLKAAGGKYAEVGQQLIRWASDDLKTYAKYSYDPNAGRFVALMIDGTPIKWQQSHTGYYVPKSFAPRQPDGFILWGYALAYRLTGEKTNWSMVRRIGRQFGLGDIGEPENSERVLNFETNHNDWRTIYALLEIHKEMDDPAILRLACRIADNILTMQVKTSLFARPGRDWARTGDEIPLALLQLAAALDGRSSLVPPAIFDQRFFHCEYHGPLDKHQQKRADKRTYDNLVFYGGS